MQNGMDGTRVIRAVELYMNNDWAFKAAGKREARPMQNGMDGTRVIRAVELYMNEYLLGQQFPPDVRLHPTANQLPKAESWEQVRDYILHMYDLMEVMHLKPILFASLTHLASCQMCC